MRPLHRSTTFWSGLLVIIFITWASWDSSWTASGSGKYGKWEALNLCNGVVVICSDDPAYLRLPGRYTPDRKGEWPRLRITQPQYIFRKVAGHDEAAFLRYPRYRPGGEENGEIEQAFLHVFIYGSPGNWAFYLPHWCLIAGMLPLWLGLLFWRARRGKPSTIVEPNP